ncbi:radical SAM family heme chaperone HemW, partial [Aduncisulcus paluster]
MDEYDAAVRGGFLGEDFEELTDEIKAQELIMLCLRTTKGLKLSDYKDLTGRDLSKEKASIISALHKNGLVRISAGYLRLTKTACWFPILSWSLLHLIRVAQGSIQNSMSSDHHALSGKEDRASMKLLRLLESSQSMLTDESIPIILKSMRPKGSST